MTTSPDLMTALTFDRTREDWHCSSGLVKDRVPKPTLTSEDRDSVIIRVQYAGFCGSDRGIWWRKAFGDMILGSLEQPPINASSDTNCLEKWLNWEPTSLALEKEIWYLPRATSSVGCVYSASMVNSMSVQMTKSLEYHTTAALLNTSSYPPNVSGPPI